MKKVTIFAYQLLRILVMLNERELIGDVVNWNVTNTTWLLV